MDPHLIAISGSLKGNIFPLTDREVSIGREGSNGICVSELSVSRRHCVIRQTGGPESPLFTVTDLESYNGTFVNGIPVIEQSLSHGDQVTLGDVQFLFLTSHPDVGAAGVQFDEADLITRSTVRLHQRDALYLQPEKLSLDLSNRVARDLNTLLEISKALSSIRDAQELQHRLLELLFDVTPAQRGAILLLDEDQQLFRSLCGWTRLSGADDSLKVSRTITQQVVRENVSLMSNDLVDQTSGVAPSLITSRVCSLLCVPLTAFGNVRGVIYLDTTDAEGRFDEGHLQLLTGVGGIATAALENARHLGWLHEENQRLQEEIRLDHQMIGQSPAMRNVYSVLSKVAPADSTVLIRGKSGTGKELAARALHLNSKRSEKSFIAINCATLSEGLLESELFGHEKGAFTGAITQKRGKLEIANGGTLFLDEVGELSPTIQVKLLRVLQEREFERVGGTQPIKVDVRVIAATNRNLEDAIKSGTFRQDLYYRLNVVSVAMPSLRERREDIPLLASYFVSKFSQQCKKRIGGIAPEARQILQSYDWPGNVRELENAIERAVVLGSGNMISPEDLPETILDHQSEPLPTRYYEGVKHAKKQLIQKALQEADGNYTVAARSLGVHPNNLHRLIRSLDLKMK